MGYPCKQITIDKESFSYYSEYDERVKQSFCNTGFDAVTFEKCQSQKWHEESKEKRCVFSKVYGGFVEPVRSDNFLDIHNVSLGKTTRILDIGGGVTAITRYLCDNYTYTLMDVLPTPSFVENRGEWSNDVVEEQDAYDIIVANDLFPNVDQRLDMFLLNYLPICSVMLLSLTTSNKWYKTKRMDGDEVLFQQSWDDFFLRSVLKRHIGRDVFDLSHGKSIFANDRNVYAVSLRGGLDVN